MDRDHDEPIERDDIDIPAGTVWPATGNGDAAARRDAPAPEPASSTDARSADARSTGARSTGARSTGATVTGPVSLDPERDDVDRNAASGGWGGATEQIENDFEDEQLRRREAGDA